MGCGAWRGLLADDGRAVRARAAAAIVVRGDRPAPHAADSQEGDFDEDADIVGVDFVVARTQPLANPLDAAQHTVPVPPVLERGDNVRLEHRPVHAGDKPLNGVLNTAHH